MSRTKKTTINSFVGILFTLLSSILSFVLQAVFIRLLGLEYAGINSLFTNILSVLNISELGVSNAILFSLYKKVADNDYDGIVLILKFHKKICLIIGSVIFGMGLCCIPFLDVLVNETPSFPESLWSLFIIVLATSSIIQILEYRCIFLIAKQDRYIVTIVNYSCIFLCHGLQIAVLALFENIYLYLLVKLFTSLLKGIVCGHITKKKYKVDWHSEDTVSRDVKLNLVKDVGALSVYKFCRTIDATIDTFLISKFISVTTTAIYGSFTMLLNSLADLLGAFNDGMIASVGDLYASGEKDRVSSIFYQSMHFYYLLYGLCSSVLVALIGPFVQWWIGYSLPSATIILMIINFYMYGLSQNISTFRNSMGLFRKGWRQPAVTVLLNLIFSVVLIKTIGLNGTLIGTIIARLFSRTWYDPYIVCRYGMDEKPYKYYMRYVCYFLITVVASILNLICRYFLPESETFLGLIWKGCIHFVISTIILVTIGFIFKEQQLLLEKGKQIFGCKIKRRVGGQSNVQ